MLYQICSIWQQSDDTASGFAELKKYNYDQ